MTHFEADPTSGHIFADPGLIALNHHTPECRSAAILGTTASFLPTLPWGRPGWVPGLTTMDITIPATSVPNGLFLMINTFEQGTVQVEVSSVITCGPSDVQVSQWSVHNSPGCIVPTACHSTLPVLHSVNIADHSSRTSHSQSHITHGMHAGFLPTYAARANGEGHMHMHGGSHVLVV